MRPGTVGRVAAIENDVVRGFKTVEPFRGLVGGIRIQHRCAAAHAGQRVGQALGDGHIAQAILQGHDGKGLGPRLAGRGRDWRP